MLIRSKININNDIKCNSRKYKTYDCLMLFRITNFVTQLQSVERERILLIL